MQWAEILIGAALLLFGRRLFWLFVGGVGFLVGFNFASQALQGQPPWVVLLIALAVGVLAAIISVFLERVVVAIAGFFAGGSFLYDLDVAVQHSGDPAVRWIAFVVGGLVGAILTAALLDPALILLSSLTGAAAIAQNVPLPPAEQGILFVVLLILGIIIQAAQYQRTRVPPPPTPAG
jgi:hypothetical protein